jgi:hypothetical protein
VNGKRLALLIPMVLVLATTPSLTLARIFFAPNYYATFSRVVSGGGPVMVTGSFLEIKSDSAENNYMLIFDSEVFGTYGGTHYGYLYMKRTSSTDPTIEIFYTYGPENGVFYQLHGFGTFEGNKKEGWFKIDSIGEFTLSEDVGATGNWQQVWKGSPSFTVEGRKL